MSNKPNLVDVQPKHTGSQEFCAITDEYDSGHEALTLTGILPPPEFINLDDGSRAIVDNLRRLNSGLRGRLREYRAQVEEENNG